jgi:transposase
MVLTAYFVLLCLQNLVSAKSARMCERAVFTNRPFAGSEPVRTQRPLEPDGGRGTDPVFFLNPNSCMGFEPGPSKEGRWMVAQNDLVVVGINIAKDKADACIRSLSGAQTFPRGAQVINSINW